jgi:hypothetical protein
MFASKLKKKPMAKLYKIIQSSKLNFRQSKFLAKVLHIQNAYKYKGVTPLDGYYYARFSHAALRQLLGNNIRKHLKDLIDEGYIIRMKDRTDHHGNFIIKIRSTKKLEEAKMIMVSSDDYKNDIHFKRYMNSISYYYRDIQATERYKESALAINQIAKTIQKTTLNITEQDVIRLYTERYHVEKRNISLEEYVKLGVNLYNDFLELKANNNLEDIKEAITISEFGRRLFHPLIGFIKKVRKYILIDGEETVGIDIQTSQVLFLAQILKETYNDTTLFDLIKSGKDIYNMIAEEENISRKKAKKLFYFMIFGWTTKFTNTFKKIFTNKTLKNIVSLKYTRIDKKIIKKNYTNLVYLLQYLESSYTIRATVANLVGRNVSFLTVHDEFIVPKSKIGLALDALWQTADEIDYTGGFSSMLKLKIS